MSKFEFKLPDIGEGVSEGEIVNWLVAQGDQVAEDQEIVEVMTDKATVTISAPKAGRIAELRGGVGDVVPVGGVLVVFDEAGDSPSAAAPAAPAAPAATETVASAVGDLRDSLPGMEPAKVAAPAPSASAYYNEQPQAAPATRKLARELNVDLRRVPPTGDSGRVTKEDVERFAAGGSAAAAPVAAPVAVAPAAAPVAAAPVAAPAAPKPAVAPPAPIPPAPVPVGASEVRIPIRGIRKRIYENMARSKRTAAHFTFVDECNASPLIALRDRTRALGAEAGVKLTFLPFIVKAVVAALKKFPELNTLVDDAQMEMVRRGTYDIGIAVSTDAGLVVPVVRGADRLSIVELAREIDRLGTAAKAGKVSPDDLGGSSFTITSLGKDGGLFATPVLNYPEVGILGIHAIKRKPVVVGDEIKIGDVMLLSLSFDHRVIDGHVGAGFATAIIQLLESPDKLLLHT